MSGEGSGTSLPPLPSSLGGWGRGMPGRWLIVSRQELLIFPAMPLPIGVAGTAACAKDGRWHTIEGSLVGLAAPIEVQTA